MSNLTDSHIQTHAHSQWGKLVGDEQFVSQINNINKRFGQLSSCVKGKVIVVAGLVVKQGISTVINMEVFIFFAYYAKKINSSCVRHCSSQLCIFMCE